MAIRPNKGYIRLNTPAGNDSTASGCGVNNVSGFGATWSQASNTIQFMGGGTSGMTVGDILWLDAGLGDRQFFEIDTITGSQSLTTVEQTTNSQMGVDYAVGGVRETLNGVESLLTYPLQNGVTAFELETNQTVQWNTTTWSGNCYAFVSSDPLAKRSITHAGGLSYFFGSQAEAICQNIIFIPGFSSGMSLSTHNSNSAQRTKIYLNNCNVGVAAGNTYDYLDDAGNTAIGPTDYFTVRTAFYDVPVRWKTNMYATKCLFSRPSSSYYSDPLGGFTGEYHFTECLFDVRQIIGGAISATQQEVFDAMKFIDCVVSANTNGFQPLFGAVLSDTDYDFSREFLGNVAYDAGTGVTWPKHGSNTKYFGTNTGVTETFLPVALPTDPFVDAANANFNLNTSQGGLDLRDSYAATLSNTAVYQYRSLLDQLPSGGGNVIVIEDN